MANLDDDKVLDVILGEAASVAKHGKQASYEDMLAIASVIANRSRQLGVPPKDVVSVKSEFNAQKPAPGMNAYRDMARQAVREVMTKGPVHNATFYATPGRTKGLPTGLQPEARTVAHSYFSDPKGRSINTAKGYISPVSISVPTPTPSPIGASRGLLDAIAQEAQPQAVAASFSQPAFAPTPTPSPRGSAIATRSNIDPIDVQTDLVKSYTAPGKQRSQDPLSHVTDFAKAAVGSFFGPGYFVDGISGKGRAKNEAKNSAHLTGHALDFDVKDPQGNKVTDHATMLGFAAHMAKMDPTIDIGVPSNGYMGAGRVHLGMRGTGFQWGPNYSKTSLSKSIMDTLDEARSIGRSRPTYNPITGFSFPETIASPTPTPSPIGASRGLLDAIRVQPSPAAAARNAQALASMQAAARPQTATTPANPNSNVIAPVRTSTTLAPVSTSVASRVPAGQTIAPVQQQPFSPNVATAQRFTPVAPSQIAAPVRGAVVAPVAPSLTASRSLSDIARSPSLAFDPQIAMATRSPTATRSVETSTVTAQPVSVRSSTPSARSAQEASMVAYNAMNARPIGSLPTPTPSPRGTYANARDPQTGLTASQARSLDAAIAENAAKTPSGYVYDAKTAPNNPVMGGSFRGFGAGGLLGNVLTGNGQFGVGGNMRGTIVGGLLGGLLAGPMGIAAGAAIGNRLGNDGGLLSGMFSGGQDNSGLFTATNPAGGRGMLDVSGGPVSLGSITVTPTPSSGGYRSTDAATRWSSYSNPQTGITTTFDAQGNTLGGPGMAPDVGGNSPSGK